jgi:hypothetical protein
LFIDESLRGREGLLGLCDDFGVGLTLHGHKNDFCVSRFRLRGALHFAALQLRPGAKEVARYLVRFHCDTLHEPVQEQKLIAGRC